MFDRFKNHSSTLSRHFSSILLITSSSAVSNASLVPFSWATTSLDHLNLEKMIIGEDIYNHLSNRICCAVNLYLKYSFALAFVQPSGNVLSKSRKLYSLSDNLTSFAFKFKFYSFLFAFLLPFPTIRPPFPLAFSCAVRMAVFCRRCIP